MLRIAVSVGLTGWHVQSVSPHLLSLAIAMGVGCLANGISDSHALHASGRATRPPRPPPSLTLRVVMLSFHLLRRSIE